MLKPLKSLKDTIKEREAEAKPVAPKKQLINKPKSKKNEKNK